MPLITYDKLIKSYVTGIKKDFPDMTRDELYNTCYKLGSYIREYLRSDDLPVVKLKLFGKFIPNKNMLLRSSNLCRDRGEEDRANWMAQKAKEVFEFERDVLYKRQKRGTGYKPKMENLNIEIIDDES